MILDNEILTLSECIAAGQNGVYISNDHYHALPGISGTKIKLLEESNKHLDFSHLFDQGNKKCYDLGTHVHTLVLEPALNNAVVIPTFENKSICGLTLAEQKSEFIADNAGKLIISQSDDDLANKMTTNVLAICSDIIVNAICERSLFAEYAPGVVIKCRIDAQVGNDDYDLKTFSPPRGDMSEWAMNQHAESLGYYKSAALRNVVRRTLGAPVGDSYLIFVSTSPGHMVKVRRIPEAVLADAEDYIEDLLLLRRRYLKNHTDIEIKNLRTKNDY